MHLSIIYFTYKNDAEILEQSIISLEKQLTGLDYKIYVFDDGHNPLDPIFPYTFEKNPKIIYYQTHYNRQKNLNGQDNNEAEAYIYNDISEKDKSDIVIKIDSDVYCPNKFREWLDEFINSDKLYTGGYLKHPRWGNTYFSGGCYMLKSIVTKPLYEDIKKYKTFHLFAPEDYIICSRLERLFPDKGLETHRIYVTQNILLGKTLERDAGYHLDPRYISMDNEDMQFVLNNSIYIATWDAMFLLKDKNVNKEKLKKLQIQVMKNLNKGELK